MLTGARLPDGFRPPAHDAAQTEWFDLDPGGSDSTQRHTGSPSMSDEYVVDARLWQAPNGDENGNDGDASSSTSVVQGDACVGTTSEMVRVDLEGGSWCNIEASTRLHAGQVVRSCAEVPSSTICDIDELGTSVLADVDVG